jgi:putative two-component system response regulator
MILVKRPAHRILVADDDESVTRLLERLVEREGLGEVCTTSDPRRVLPLYLERRPDLVLLDIQMPQLDGLAVLRQIRGRTPADHFLPVIVISGNHDPTLRIAALRSGASDFVSKPINLEEMTLRIREVLRTRDLTLSLEQRLAERTARLEEREFEAVRRLGMIAELRDYADAEHPRRVGDTAAAIAAELELPDTTVELIRAAAPLHDIGKIAIPEAILLKPGALSLEEFDVMRSHTTIGARLLGGSDSELFQLAEEIALYHHENWDGTGYTPGLDGEAIPLSARIVRVADAFDALIQERPYKSAWTWEDAVAWIDELAGVRFDPAIVSAFRRTQEMRVPSRAFA